MLSKRASETSFGCIRATLSIFGIQLAKPKPCSFKQTLKSGYVLRTGLLVKHTPSMYEVLQSMFIFWRKCLIQAEKVIWWSTYLTYIQRINFWWQMHGQLHFKFMTHTAPSLTHPHPLAGSRQALLLTTALGPWQTSQQNIYNTERRWMEKLKAFDHQNIKDTPETEKKDYEYIVSKKKK